MKNLTLCESCRELLSMAYEVQPVYDSLTLLSKMDVKKCENCKKANRDLKVFTVGKKGT